ncbi:MULTISPECIES: hypothetical protein [unclassified Bradyrhizobium]|uniref:hypothetical protein n=1 Tax=unclassified Bradyrhizobium TaxID=2631580 RepID=UPI0020B215C1|nr:MULTISPECIES: hypothetical protein [unclassified Bradyrhizobium]MCP3468292.1 hypothetical protein [Bradyrhizobium sp. CCGUVB23]MCP3477699.1 hypothetical protein [Bradyrhizobium sp. CCGUVB1N3]
MPRFIASYDLNETKPDAHEKLINKAIEHGWPPWVLDHEHTSLFTLPNATLQGSFVDQTQAVAALNATRAETGKDLGTKVIMEKWIVVRYDAEPDFDSNEREKAG